MSFDLPPPCLVLTLDNNICLLNWGNASLVGLSRDSYRIQPQPDQLTRELGERIVDIAHVRRRFGYRRIHDLLRSEFPGVNHNRVYRLYKNANLAVLD